MEIKDSARKHGITDADINHALSNPVFVHYFEDHQIVVGPAAAGDLLEIGINRRGQAFHAMMARPKYYRAR